MQYGHNVQFKDDAAASVGTNHVIYKTAANYVEVNDQQMVTSMGITPNVWQSESVMEMREERFKVRELELLSWAGIDLTAKVISLIDPLGKSFAIKFYPFKKSVNVEHHKQH